MVRRLCFYSRRTNAELEAMYKARTGKDMPKTKKRVTKKDMANELRKVDRRPWNYGSKFRFQDLPAEMRNLVYRELLPVPRGFIEGPFAHELRECQPAIIRTCKQIHSEAKSILYGDHEGQVLIRPKTFPPQTLMEADRETFIFGRMKQSFQGSRLANNRPGWPSCLLNFERVEVRARLGWVVHRQVTPDALFVMNQELLGLVSFLSCSTALKTLRVNVLYFDSQPQGSDLVSMLQPLTRISPKVGVEMINVPQETQDQILSERETCTGKKHFFADFQEMQTSLKELEAFRFSVDPKNTLLSIQDQQTSMDAALGVTGYVDDQVEKQLREATARAKAFLAGGIVDKVNRMARRKTMEMKQQTAKKVDELEGLRQKFVEVEKAARKTSPTKTE